MTKRLSSKTNSSSPIFGDKVRMSVLWIMKQFDWTRLFTRPYKVYTQVVFWIVVFILYLFLKEYPTRMVGLTAICMVFQITLELAIPSYSQNLLIVPLFKRRKWFLGGFLYMVQVVVLIFGLPYVLNAVGFLFPIQDRVDWRNEHIAFSVVAFTVMATIFKIGLDRLILDKQQKENELRHLKAQLNPHFLFNTLNNLYGLSVVESKKLPGLMLKLSELLRYSLYDTNQNYVAVSKELDYISNYVELERIRLSEKTDITLDISGDYNDHYIAPLLLIIFVENAFKHFSASKGQTAFVHIHIDIKNNHLKLKVQNSVDPEYTPVKNKSRGGLGLNNVKQRLDLIYPQQHQLTIAKENNCFQVNLEIDLS
ncbi:histidine kinase [Mucilaginibacter sp. BJC16-A38]|uniref:sensor histidine kinase n=1 Tax=Mucilaginibacter phenanthrenivorans TaxID=1234842 RepID=UPI0021579943|nr:histidine kinase [Mucilaginibacter phenanthrenivorans]MCR8561200.1 histidine kinase [Mucilaginibacter phenanthrenivorans]